METGCILAGHNGWRISGLVIQYAKENGFPLTDSDSHLVSDWLNGDADDVFETIVFLCDEAEVWLNHNVAAEGHSFGFHDGEFFYWPDLEWSLS